MPATTTSTSSPTATGRTTCRRSCENAVYGGAGTDTVHLQIVEPAYGPRATIDLVAQRITFADPAWRSQILGSIENAYGSDAYDTMIGTDGANMLDGGYGADTLYGGGGADDALRRHRGQRRHPRRRRRRPD